MLIITCNRGGVLTVTNTLGLCVNCNTDRGYVLTVTTNMEQGLCVNCKCNTDSGCTVITVTQTGAVQC